MIYFKLVGGNMKKGIISILAVLTVFAMVIVSCPEPETETQPEGDYTVTFNKNNTDPIGTTEADPPVKHVILPDTTIGELPVPPTRSEGWGAGMTFVEWNTQRDGKGETFDADTPVTGNMEVYAQWKFVNGTAKVETIYLVNDAPLFAYSEDSETFGEFNGTKNYNGSFTFESGAIQYSFPANLSAYDFMTIDYITEVPEGEPPLKVILKQYNKRNDYIPRIGNQWPTLDESGSLEFAIVNAEGSNGIAIQYNTDGTGPSNGTLKITKITFSTGTRRYLNFNKDEETGRAASRMEITEGIAFPQSLPVLSSSGKSFRGWKDAAGYPITNFSYLDIKGELWLTAQWADKPTGLTALTVDYTNNKVEGKGLGFSESDAKVEATSNGYKLTYGNGNGYENTWVKFIIHLEEDVSLADYNTVTFSLQGNSGDFTYKNIEVLGAKELGTEANPVETNSTSVITTQHYIQYTNGTQSMSFNLDPITAGPMIGPGDFEISIYIPANYRSDNTANGNSVGTTAFTISNVKFNPRS
jgi:hypothetical protein